MNSKGIIAIAVVAILVAAGVGAGIFFALKNGDNGTLSVDKVKDTLAVGDYMEITEEVKYEESSNTTQKTFLENFYYSGSGEPVREETINFDGKDCKCNVWVKGSTTTFTTVESGFLLKKISEYVDEPSETLEIKSTDLDINKKMDEQKLKNGSTVVYNLKIHIKDAENKGTETYVYSVDKDGKETETMITEYSGKNTTKIKEIKDDTVVLEDGNIISAVEFLQFISLKDWEEFQKSMGYTVARNSIRYDTIETPFGNRDVSIENVTVKESNAEGDKDLSHYNLVHGSEGFMYSIEMYYDDETEHMNMKVSVTDTNLRI